MLTSLRGAEARLEPFPPAAAAESGQCCGAPLRSGLRGTTPSGVWPTAAGAGRPRGCWAFPTCRGWGGSCGLEGAWHLGRLWKAVRAWVGGEARVRIECARCGGDDEDQRLICIAPWGSEVGL